MKKLATTVLVTSLALAGFSSVYADGERHAGYGHHEEHGGKYCDKNGKGNRLERMKQHLGLSDQQVGKMQSLREKYQPQKQALREKTQATRQALRQAMHADTVDQRAVAKLAKEMGDLKAEKIILHGKMRSEMNTILTKEQRQKMQEWKQHRGEHGEKHHGPRE